MGLLTLLRGNSPQPEYDPLKDGDDVSAYALSSFINVVEDLQYANETYQKVKDHAASVIREHETRMKAAVAAQQKNTKIVSKINEFLGVDDASNEDQETHG